MELHSLGQIPKTKPTQSVHALRRSSEHTAPSLNHCNPFPSFEMKWISDSILLTTLMDWAFVHKVWDKWASTCIGSSGQPLKAALLINHDPTAPSRLLSTISSTVLHCLQQQEGINANPIELSQFVDFIKRYKLQSESFFIGLNQYVVTSIHENWFSARCMNTSKPAGEGAIVMHTAAFLLVALYDGSIGSASRAMVVVDQCVVLQIDYSGANQVRSKQTSSMYRIQVNLVFL
ncbi:hypothetical protein HYC85_027199 [Camellia sinensis]|uniref:Profilin n=1 Tax=Camellia sinensis TaxID=4442 RepID=A0A7J7G5R8_CAMSI|nr:hypothetical protein HYC85_027199 [Camellia sinensis]